MSILSKGLTLGGLYRLVRGLIPFLPPPAQQPNEVVDSSSTAIAVESRSWIVEPAIDIWQPLIVITSVVAPDVVVWMEAEGEVQELDMNQSIEEILVIHGITNPTSQG